MTFLFKWISGIILSVLLIATNCSRAWAIPMEDEFSDGVAQVPIIMYHVVTNNSSLWSQWGITPEEFESDLRYMKEHGFNPVTMTDLVNFVHNGGSLPEKPIVLTFDDGDHTVYRFVFPLLKKYEMKAVVSIIGKVTDDYSNDAREDIRYPHLLWNEINEMRESGLVEIQNHSYNLHRTNSGTYGARKLKSESDSEYKKRMLDDIGKLQDRILEMTGVEANTFVYPFGAISKQSDEVMKGMGFLASLSCNDKVNEITVGDSDCLFSLGRTIRPHGYISANIFNKLDVVYKR